MLSLFSRISLRLTFGISVVLIAMMLVPGLALADKIDSLSRQLRGSSSYKVRLSAALTLTRIRSERGIEPLMRALRDREKSVRGVSAAGLGKLVTTNTALSTRARVLDALKRVMATDKDKFVRRQARRAYTVVKALNSKPRKRSGRIFIDVGAMGDKTGRNELLRKLMRITAANTLTQKAPSMAHGIAPSAAKLRRMNAFHIDATLTELTVKKSGLSAQIGCKVSMLMATFPKKSMFGFLSGGAVVKTGSSSQDVRSGKKDCVTAVITDLVTRRVIPTLKKRAAAQ